MHSAWYGRRTLKLIQRHLLHRHSVDCIMACAGKQLPMSDSDWESTKILRLSGKREHRDPLLACKKTYSTGYSQAVTHPSTNPAQCCLTSVIRREPVHSAWYGRRTLHLIQSCLLYRHSVDCISAITEKQLPMSDSNWDITKILRLSGKREHRDPLLACKKTYSTGYSQAVTHPSTNPAQCCLTSVIRREPVHSAWYGRRTLKLIQRHLLHRHSVDCIMACAGKQLPMSDSDWESTKILRLSGKREHRDPLLACKKTYSTGYSQAVTHPSTNPAQCCLTSVIRREPVHSAWYGQRTLKLIQRHLLYRHSVDCISAITEKQLPMSDSNWDITKILRLSGKREHRDPLLACKKTYSTGYSQAVTHPSTNPAQCCLTSVIRREAVHSAWYGRRTLKLIQRHLLYRHSVDCILAFTEKQLPMSDSNWDITKILRLSGKREHRDPLLVCKKTYSTGYSQAVTHPSTNPAQCCLTSVIRREPVHSAWYGRRTLKLIQRHLLYRYSVDCISAFTEKQLPMSDSNWDITKILRLSGKREHRDPLLACKKTYSTGYSQAVTHPSTNPAQCCLTSVIRREPVHSAWYGRRTLKLIQRHLLYRHSVDCITAFTEKQLPMSHNNWDITKILRLSGKREHRDPLLACKKTYSTGYSQAVTHPSTNLSPMLLNFGDQTRTGAFSMVWP